MEASPIQVARPSIQICKIIIIGAGAAGLSAANHLVRNQVDDFIILEGRNRIGGRIVSVAIEGKKIELGANWIHGILGNPIYELASTHGLVNIIQENKDHNVIAYLPNGQKVPFSIVQEIYDAYFLFFKRCEEYYLCKYLPPDNIDSVGMHIKLEVSIYLQQYTGFEREVRERIFNYLLNKETCISGCNSMDDIDLMEIGSFTELPGGNIELPAGYSSILIPLSRNIPEQKILKGHNVTCIRWKILNESRDSPSSEFQVNESPAKRQRQKVQVLCENGARFLAESVICTVPLGVLKANGQSMFDPPLPNYKVESISRLCFGVVDKIYLEYERPFLRPELSEIVLLWDTFDPKKPISERWFKKIHSFTKVSETLLLGWVSGEEAKFMETLPFDIVSQKCTEILRQFLNDPCVPSPKRCICTSWWSQPLTKGSYTAIAVSSSQVDISNISHPLYSEPTNHKPAVLFAGEHCHPTFYSTVHGAYLSGREAAQILCIPDTPQELVLDVDGTADLSSWIQGLSLTS